MGGGGGKGANTRAAQIQADAQSEIAAIQSASALEAAHIQAGAGIHAAEIGAGATMYAADLQHNAANRALDVQQEQFNRTEQRFAPFVAMGSSFLDDVAQASTVDGLDQRIAQILDTDTFSSLYDDRMRVAENYNAQHGAVRSGAAVQDAADISTDLALGLENQLYGRQLTNVNIGQSSAAQVGGFSQNYANAVTGIETGTAANIGNLAVQGAGIQAQGILTAGNAAAQGIINSNNAIANGLQNTADAQAGAIYAGQQQRAAQQQSRVGGAASGAMIGYQFGGPWGAAAGAAAGYFFSDERLKMNMQPVGKIHDLTLYEWDWRHPDLIGQEMSLGFSAQEVEEKYPHHTERVHDLIVIDYPGLTHELRGYLQ